MLNSKQTVTFNYFVGSGSMLTDTTKTTADLTPLQLGLFNSQNYKALASPTSGKAVPEIIIAMGSPNDEKISWTNSSMSFKSVPIRADKLIAWRKSYPKRGIQHRVAIGWDGTSDCKNITAICDKTYSLNIELGGSPALRFFGGKPLTESFFYTTECCDCTAEPCTPNVEVMVDSFINQINKNTLISPFVKAKKIVEYVTPPTVTTVAYSVYEVTLCDEGSSIDLYNIQAAYPDTTITRKSRIGGQSTYSLTQLASLPAPADYSNQNITVIANCTECPDGYTLVPLSFKYKVQRQDLGLPADVTTVEGDYAATSAVRLSYVNGESTYEVIIEGTVAPAPVAPGDIITTLYEVAPFCELTTPSTFTFVLTETLQKVVRTLCLDLGEGICQDNDDQLNELVAYYTGNPSVVQGSLVKINDGKCANSYTIDQVSDNFIKDDCYVDLAVFSDLTPYKDAHWKQCCPGGTMPEVDKIGIVLEGAYIDSKFGTCSFKYDDFVETDLVKIDVVEGDFAGLDNKCATSWAVTQLQAPQYPTGIGTNVLKDYISVQTTKGQLWCDDPRMREIHGYKYDFIKPDKYYKIFYLEFEALDKYFYNTGFGGNDFKQTVAIAFEEGIDTSAFENAIEGWINSVRPDLINADVQDNLYR